MKGYLTLQAALWHEIYYADTGIFGKIFVGLFAQGLIHMLLLLKLLGAKI